MVSVALGQNKSTLTVAAMFKETHIRKLIPQGIIYGLKNKIVAKYLKNPLERAIRLNAETS